MDNIRLPKRTVAQLVAIKNDIARELKRGVSWDDVMQVFINTYWSMKGGQSLIHKEEKRSYN